MAPSTAELVRRRTSCRSFEPRPLEAADRAALEDWIATLPPGPFGGRPRLGLLDAAEAEGQAGGKLGTYGVIRGAQLYLAGALRPQEPGSLEDFGWGVEWLILQATGRGIGSCWLGGTFRRERFQRALRLADGEMVPAVTPLGYPTAKRSLVDRAFRWSAGSAQRKPLKDLVFSAAWGQPLATDEAGPYLAPLEALRLAPSASNRQPWRVLRRADGREFQFLLQRSLPARGMFEADLQRIDLGIGMCHFELVAREAGLSGAWQPSPPSVAGLPRDVEPIATWLAG